MARKKKTAPADGEVLPIDTGPSVEEQAMVDAEQREIMARNKVIRDAEEKAERENHAAKLERNAATKARRQSIEDAIPAILRRLEALEAKING